MIEMKTAFDKVGETQPVTREEVERRLEQIREKQIATKRPVNPQDYTELSQVRSRSCILHCGFNHKLQTFTCYCVIKGGVDRSVWRRTRKNGLLSMFIQDEFDTASVTVKRCLVIRQSDKSDWTVFIRIVGRAIEMTDASVELAVVEWQRLYGNLKFCAGIDAEPLSRAAAVGLVAELKFMKECRKRSLGTSWAALMRVWKGPLGAAQDFDFGQVRVEVKSSAAKNPTKIRISSLQQLDFAGGVLFLAFRGFPELDEGDSLEQSAGEKIVRLCDLIEEIKEDMKSERHATAEYEDRLRMLGIRSDARSLQPQAKTQFRVMGDWTYYAVSGGVLNRVREFPRLTSEKLRLPEGIEELSYSILKGSISAFEIGEDEFWSGIENAL